jgi:hypothetical protein
MMARYGRAIKEKPRLSGAIEDRALDTDSSPQKATPAP